MEETSGERNGATVSEGNDKNELRVCSSGKMVLGVIRTSGICTLRIKAKKRKNEEKITFRIVSKLTVLFPFWKKRFRVSSVGLTPLCKR